MWTLGLCDVLFLLSIARCETIHTDDNALNVGGIAFPSDSVGGLCCCPNDRRAVGAVFGVGIASIGILPTSATVYGATSMVSPLHAGIASIHLRRRVLV